VDLIGEMVTQKIEVNEEWKRLVDGMFDGNTPEDIDWQKVAVLLGLKSRFLIITGGPGTGKTTTVSRLLAVKYMLNPSLKIALAAPTGKAASRLNESMSNNVEKLNVNREIKDKLIELKAFTLHKLLGAHGNVTKFRYNKSNRLLYDLVVVDEASMIDISLMHKLLSALKPGASLILLGDKDQLASVEAGSVFGDLCRSVLGDGNRTDNFFDETTAAYLSKMYGKSFDAFIVRNPNMLTGNVVQLTKSHRFKTGGKIAQLASKIIKSEIDGFQTWYDNNDDSLMLFSTKEDAMPVLNEWINDFVPPGNYDDNALLRTLDKLKILCAVNNDIAGYGTEYMNMLVENKIKSLSGANNGDFYKYRQIMVTHNDYENGVFNGDMGIIDFKDGTPKLLFPTETDTPKIIDPHRLSGIQTAFAITIHKSQGSEFDKVVIVLPSSAESKILTRELLYTAVTRARQKVMIIASPEVLRTAMKKKAYRSSGITDRVTNKKIN
jgi:exodeoxyribonuclease V alpha subunit